MRNRCAIILLIALFFILYQFYRVGNRIIQLKENTLEIKDRAKELALWNESQYPYCGLFIGLSKFCFKCGRWKK